MIERGNSNPARTKIPCASIWSATSSTRDIAVSCSSSSAYLSMSISRRTNTVDSPWTSCGQSPVSSSRCVQAPYYPLCQQSYKHLPNVFVGTWYVYKCLELFFCPFSPLVGAVEGYGCFCTCMGAPPFAALDCITYIQINMYRYGRTEPDHYFLQVVSLW